MRARAPCTPACLQIQIALNGRQTPGSQRWQLGVNEEGDASPGDDSDGQELRKGGRVRLCVCARLPLCVRVTVGGSQIMMCCINPSPTLRCSYRLLGAGSKRELPGSDVTARGDLITFLVTDGGEAGQQRVGTTKSRRYHSTKTDDGCLPSFSCGLTVHDVCFGAKEFAAAAASDSPSSDGERGKEEKLPLLHSQLAKHFRQVMDLLLSTK